MTEALIVTAMLDLASQLRFNNERQRYFPVSRNFLSAHVTLFHALPGGHLDSILSTLDTMCSTQTLTPFETSGLRFLGRGVAYELHMPALVALRAGLAASWSSWLTPQDREAFRPHITVQNKVAPEAAKNLLSELQKSYIPWRGEVTGLAVWRYENGPWSNICEMLFGDNGN